MGSLNSFTFCTLNGFYKDDQSGIDWHVHGSEEAGFSSESLGNNHSLLFGRVTYEMMASFWPTSQAHEAFPEVAKGMNSAKKLVVSSSLKTVEWANSQILGKDWLDELRKLKQSENITLLGSGMILTQLAEANLIDLYQIMLDPVVIGKGTPIFDGINSNMHLELTDKRIFNSGTILLSYKPK
ncbi:MAG: dihydrofolate reductase family protein [Bacteroidota bacterium]